MLKKILLISLGAVTLGGTGLYFYFKGSNNHLELIPKNAAIVMSINFTSLFKKLDFNGEFKNTEFSKKLNEEMGKNKLKPHEDKIFESLKKDPMSCGINLLSPVYIYAVADKVKNYGAAVIDIKDLDKFEVFIKQFPELTISNYIDYKTTVVGNSLMLIWNKKGLVLMEERSYNKEISDAKDIILIPSKDNIKQNPNFKHFEDKNDFNFYISYKELMKLPQLNRTIDQIENLFNKNDETVVVGSLEFKDNEIVLESEIKYPNSSMKESMNFYNEKGISEEAINLMTTDKLIAGLSMNLDLIKIKNIFKTYSVQMYDQVDKTLKEQGLSMDEIAKSFSGEITLSLNGFESKQIKSMSYEYNESIEDYELVEVNRTQNMPKFNVSVGVKDKNTLAKIMKLLPFQKSGNVYNLNNPNMNSSIVETNYGVTFTSDSLFAQQLATNVKYNNKIDSEIKNKFKNSSAYFYFDFSSTDLSNYIKTSIEGNQEFNYESTIAPMLKTYKYAEAIQKDNKSTINLSLTEGKGNSLLKTIKSFDNVFIEQKRLQEERNKKYEEMLKEEAITDELPPINEEEILEEAN